MNINREINSREYKVMLKANKFKGDEQELGIKVNKYWYSFSQAIQDIVPVTNNIFEPPEKRLVRFYDTKDKILYRNDYVFRERTNTKRKKREVTLKFRHRDRYLSQARDMTAQEGIENKEKFEEDIKPPIFVSLYSFSNKCKIDAGKDLNKLNDPGGLFPDLPQRLGKAYDGDKKIKVVNDFTAYQIVIEGTTFQIDHATNLQCECALIFWYDKKFTKKPVVAEFSFKYKSLSDAEDFGGTAAAKAFAVFQILQKDKDLKKWVDLEGTTKTRFAYEYSGKS